MIYFDSAATTLQKPASVARQTAHAMSVMASPGRGGHAAAMRAADAVFQCRQLAAELFAAQPEQVCFTLNATHGLNIAIHSLVQPGDRVVISGFEHNAVTRPLYAIGAQTVVAGTELFRPQTTLEAFDRAVTSDTAAVIVNHVSNVFGYIQPIEEIADLCRERKVPLIVDASQSAGALSVRTDRLGAAFIAMPGHKGLYGPQGTGLLICTRLPKPLMQGGTGSMSAMQQMPSFLPDRVEAGTPNVPGICGLGEGLRYVRRRKPETILAHEQALKNVLVRELAPLAGVRLFTGSEGTQSGVLSFCIDGMDCEEAAQKLAQSAMAVRAGLHCAPLAHACAGTLESGTIRASFSDFNTPEECRLFARRVRALLTEKRSR